MALQKHNFLYFTASPPTIDKFSICAEPFHPSLVRPTATPRPRSDHLLHIPSAIHPSFQPLLNHDPTAPQPFPKHPATTLQPRLNHPSCRIQERFRHNHLTFVIIQLRKQPLLNHAKLALRTHHRTLISESARNSRFAGAVSASSKILHLGQVPTVASAGARPTEEALIRIFSVAPGRARTTA